MSKYAVAILLMSWAPVSAMASYLPVEHAVEAHHPVSAPEPGAGITTDPEITVGSVDSLPTIVTAGDIVVCDFGVSCNSSTPKSGWSDIVVFYNSGKGPYVTDSTVDANSVYIFSDGPELGKFLVNYDTGKHGRLGLSSDVVFITEDASGNAKFGDYEFSGLGDPVKLNGQDAVVPEPNICVPLGLLLAAVAIRRRSADGSRVRSTEVSC